MKKNFFFICWAILTLGLVYFSWGAYNPSSSILAQVEPVKQAISFHKAVKVKEIYVMPGQKVKVGDPLLKVERQDLFLDVETKTNALESLKSEKRVFEIEIEYEQNLEKNNLDVKSQQLDAEIKRLNLIQNNQQQLSESLAKFNIWNDSVNLADPTYITMRINVLQNEKKFLISRYRLMDLKNAQLQLLNVQEIEKKISLVKKELELLSQEEIDLVRVAKKEGIIGNVYAEVEELISPFTTLISIYDDNPNIIRALIHEDLRVQIDLHQSVTIESTNGRYETQGTILEIGNRIIEYPARLKQNKELLTYGREIFISISEKSNFLHGEKVYVKLK